MSPPRPSGGVGALMTSRASPSRPPLSMASFAARTIPMKTIRIGRRGQLGDRIEPVVELAERATRGPGLRAPGRAETMALAQQGGRASPGPRTRLLQEAQEGGSFHLRRTGYDPPRPTWSGQPLLARARPASCSTRPAGWAGLAIAAVTGDDVLREVMAVIFTSSRWSAARCCAGRTGRVGERRPWHPPLLRPGRGPTSSSPDGGRPGRLLARRRLRLSWTTGTCGQGTVVGLL